MHFDTKLLIINVLVISSFAVSFGQYSDEQSYFSLIEFNRGGPSTNLIFSSPHGGFLGANLTSRKVNRTSSNDLSSSPSFVQLPIAGCYNDTLNRCVYSLRDCLRSNNNNEEHLSFHPDARCMIDRSSSSTMYLLTKTIAESFSSHYRPFTILNKLSRHYVDPAEDLLIGTFLFESATRVYMDYHRLVAMAKEYIRSPKRGLLIEFVFHKNSQTVQLGYGFEPNLIPIISKSFQSTIPDLITRLGPGIIRGNNSLGYFLHRNGFQSVVPMEQQQQQRMIEYRLSTHSTRTHADQRFNVILLSYPIERLRTHTLKFEALRIAKAIEQFIQTNNIKSISAFLLPSIPLIIQSLLFSSQICSILYNSH